MDAIVRAASRLRIPAHLEAFIAPSYPVTTPADTDSYFDATYYNKGPKDLLFVGTWVLLLAICREALMRGFFMPLARWRFDSLARAKQNRRATKRDPPSAGDKLAKHHPSVPAVRQRKVSPSSKPPKSIKSWTETKKARDAKLRERKVVRFAEQGWSLAYYAVFWAFGMGIYINLPCFLLQTKHFWVNYPVRFLPGPIKFYYLCQLACWVHQLIVLNIEERRKDHFQMLAHHIITIALITGSYISHFTRIGIAVLVIMDFCDIILPLAKMLLYLELPSVLPDTVFGLFVVSWLVTRQGAFTLVVWSAFTESNKYVAMDFRPMDGRFWSKYTYYGFCTFLLALLALLWAWFWMICRLRLMSFAGSRRKIRGAMKKSDAGSSSSATLAPNSNSNTDSDSDTLAGSQSPTPPKVFKKQ
ncbi:longevity-assurance protein [Rhizoctonia solani]|uniref:Longevity-assurance protein n=1 Tax=Rhizoctonia solani TaxID=456999 RepID=A0A8H7IMA9_9AGAM|nr:longevity-assurance protein [Rhizoctonia solani]